MRFFYKVLAALCLLSAASFAQSTATITGHISDPTNTAVTAKTLMHVELISTGGNQCRVGGTTLVTPYAKDFSPTAGAWSFSLIKSSSLTCGTTTGASRWKFTVFYNGQPQNPCVVNVTGNVNLDSTACLNATGTIPATAPASSLFCLIDGSNCGFTGAITGTSFNFSGNGIVQGTLVGPSIGKIIYADQKCTSAGVFDSTCFSNAVSALPNGGTVIVNAHTYNFGATTLTFAPANGNINFVGDCIGNIVGSNCPRIQGTASPLIAVTGTNASTRTVNLSFNNIIFNPSAFSASQICIQSDHASNIYLNQVQFENCGQAEDINDVYRQIHWSVSYDNCGSGDTAATACVRAENRSNTGVRSEEIYWDHGLWQGAAHQGMALWAGPFTQEVFVYHSKLDYGGTTPTFRLVAFNNSWQGGIIGSTVAAATITTANSVVEVSGTDGTTRSQNITISDNPVISTLGTIPAVRLDWARWSVVSGNILGGSGTSAGLATLTANSLDNVVIGNGDTISTDVIALDSGTADSVMNHQNNGVWALSSASIAGRLLVTGAIGGVTAAMSNNADSQANFNFGGGATTGQDVAINFQDNTPTTQAQIICASVAHGGRCTASANSTNGFQWDRTGIFYLSKQLNAPTNVLISTTAPTIAAGGCGGAAASIATNNGTAAFSVNVGTTPTTACTITMPTAANGWNCFATDITTNSTTVFLQKQTATGATSVTITNFNDVAVGANFTASDILQVSCFAR